MRREKLEKLENLASELEVCMLITIDQPDETGPDGFNYEQLKKDRRYFLSNYGFIINDLPYEKTNRKSRAFHFMSLDKRITPVERAWHEFVFGIDPEDNPARIKEDCREILHTYLLPKLNYYSI